MSAVAYTPGPWTAGSADFFGDYNISQAATENRAAVAAVVSNMRMPSEVAANATLIAAAPDMLETLQAMDAFWSADGASPDDHHWSDDMQEIWHRIRSTIAQATAPAPPEPTNQDLLAALTNLVDALAANDEDGLTEFSEPMAAARAAIAKARAVA